MIGDEIVRALRADDDLSRLNSEAREQTLRVKDEESERMIRREVARILSLPGTAPEQSAGRQRRIDGAGINPSRGGRRRPGLASIAMQDPPTYISIVWPDEAITFHAEQRRYVRLETDASSRYHDPGNPGASRLNVILETEHVSLRGSAPLVGGRLRIILSAQSTALVGASDRLRVELSRPGLSTLSDERLITVIDPPQADDSAVTTSLPNWNIQPVDGPDDPIWSQLGWPLQVSEIASSAEFDSGTLEIYYSTVLPRFAGQRRAFEQRDPAVATSFTHRYEIWLAVHSLLLYRDQQESVEQTVAISFGNAIDADPIEQRDREERRRMAELAVIVASREAQLESGTSRPYRC